MAREYSEKAFLLEIDDYSLVEEYFKNRNISGFYYTKDDKKKQVAEETAEKIEAVLRKQLPHLWGFFPGLPTVL